MVWTAEHIASVSTHMSACRISLTPYLSHVHAMRMVELLNCVRLGPSVHATVFKIVHQKDEHLQRASPFARIAPRYALDQSVYVSQKLNHALWPSKVMCAPVVDNLAVWDR